MELHLPRPISVGLEHGGGSVGLHRRLCSDWGRGRPVLLALGVQPADRVAEAVVLPEE
jgi:hypothetical protein